MLPWTLRTSSTSSAAALASGEPTCRARAGAAGWNGRLLTMRVAFLAPCFAMRWRSRVEWLGGAVQCHEVGVTRAFGRRIWDAILGSVVARTDSARESSEAHQNVLRNLAPELDGDAADLDIADGIALRRGDLKNSSQPQTWGATHNRPELGGRRSVGCDPTCRIQAADVQPHRIREGDRRALSRKRVHLAADRRIARASGRAISRTADQCILIRQQLALASPQDGRLCGDIDLSFQRVRGMCEMHGAVGGVPLVARIVDAVLEEVAHLHGGTDQLLIEREQFVLVAVRVGRLHIGGNAV